MDLSKLSCIKPSWQKIFGRLYGKCIYFFDKCVNFESPITTMLYVLSILVFCMDLNETIQIVKLTITNLHVAMSS